QCCAFRAAKSFFNSIDPKRTLKYFACDLFQSAGLRCPIAGTFDLDHGQIGDGLYWRMHRDFLRVANMPSPKDSARQPTYLYEMIQRLGIEPGGDVVPRLSLAYMTAFHRYQTCPVKEACREWLDIMPRSVASAPNFCPNDDILFELRINQPGRASVAVDHHAYITDLERFVDEIDELLLHKANDDPLVGELKSRKVRLCDEIEWLRRKPSQQAYHIGS